MRLRERYVLASLMSDTPIPEERPKEYLADVGFDDLGLSEPLRRAVRERGYAHPTPVQAQAFAPVVAGRDLIVRSKTGTGKTAAFGLPLLEKIPTGERNVKALILCPTRELALQVAAEISDLGKHKDLKITAIYGGASMKVQEDALEFGSAIIVGTPGRVFDHIQRGNLKLETCTHVVLDEADEMLNQGFYEDVTEILDYLPKNRQVLLFSATVPPDIQRLIARYTTNAETLLLSGDVLTVDHIHHIRYEISDAYPKPRNLIYALEMEEPESSIIFCNTRDDTELVTAVLNRNGFDSELLNGDLPQKERERVMAKVKRGEVAYMVATDIAARGIDISDLSHVINYSLPEDPAVYLHRVGRTGRIGKKGTAINLTSGRELATLTTLEKKFNIQFERRHMPSPEEALRLWTERHVREIKESLGSSVYEGFLPLAGQLKQRPDADDLIGFLLKYFFTHHRMEKAQNTKAKEQSPAPVRSEKRKERTKDKPSRSAERSRDAKPPRERRPREEEAVNVGPGQAQLWIGLGQADNLDADGLKAALEAAGAPAGKIAAVAMRRSYAYAVVAEEDVAGFEALSGKEHQGRALKVERAKPPGPPRREKTQNREETPGQARLWVNLGSADGLDAQGVVGALEAAGAPSGKAGTVQLRQTYAYVHVADEDVAAFESTSGKNHGDKALKVERSRRA